MISACPTTPRSLIICIQLILTIYYPSSFPTAFLVSFQRSTVMMRTKTKAEVVTLHVVVLILGDSRLFKLQGYGAKQFQNVRC